MLIRGLSSEFSHPTSLTDILFIFLEDSVSHCQEVAVRYVNVYCNFEDGIELIAND